MTLTEIIARLEELDKAMNDGSLPVTARACYRWDLTNKLRTHARTLIAAGKVAEKAAVAFRPGTRVACFTTASIQHEEFVAALAELDETINEKA